MKENYPYILHPYSYIDNNTIIGLVMQRGHISLNEYFKIFNIGTRKLDKSFVTHFIYILLLIIESIEKLH